MKKIILGLVILSLVVLVGCKQIEEEKLGNAEMNTYTINEGKTNSYFFVEGCDNNDWQLRYNTFTEECGAKGIEVWFDTPNCIDCTI